MDWLFGALIVSVLFGIINNLDSHLISRKMPEARTYLFIVSCLILAYILPFVFAFPLAPGTPGGVIAAAAGSALARAVAVIIMLFAFKSEEVVAVVPLVYAYPVIVAIAAIPLFGEHLGWIKWLAVIAVVSGAVLVSLRPRFNQAGRWLGRKFPVLVLAAVLFAGSDLGSKYVLGYMSNLNLYWMSMLALIFTSLCVSARPEVIRSIKNIQTPRRTIPLVILTELLVIGAAILTYWAIQNGPIALVSTTLATRPLFVFLVAVILSRLFPGFVYWQSDRTTLRDKFIAILMIAGGIAVIYLL